MYVYIRFVNCVLLEFHVLIPSMSHPRLLSREVAGLSFGSQELEGSCKAAAEGESHLGTTPLAARVSGTTLTREPYTCERLARIRGGFRALTGSHRVLEFDFDNPEVRIVIHYSVCAHYSSFGLMFLL